MILTQTQAEAILSAVAHLNNIGAFPREIFGNGFRVRATGTSGGVWIVGNVRGEIKYEKYENLSDFATAYGIA